MLDPAGCDPRALLPGELRGRRVPCTDELPGGSDGRIGDWILENAVARYVIRDVFAPLTELRGDGGTLIDAVVPGGEDLLLELTPQGDRSEITLVESDDRVGLVLPGMSYSLGVDDAALLISAAGPTEVRVLVKPGAARTGLSWREEPGDAASFLAVDGELTDAAGVVWVDGLTRVAVTPEARWPDGDDLLGEADVDALIVSVDGAPAYTLPVAEGAYAGRVPAHGRLQGARDGCTYDGLVMLACGGLTVRVTDADGVDIAATVLDPASGDSWPLLPGGGRAPVGPGARALWVWAGPAYDRAELWFPDGEAEARVVLSRRLDLDADGTWLLADLDREIAPDVDTAFSPADALSAARAEGVHVVALRVDDEIPTFSQAIDDPLIVFAASRARDVWSWDWEPNSKRPAHGAVDPQDLLALDRLSMSEGSAASRRLTVVNTDWLAAAWAEEPEPARWDPRPTAVWLAGPEDIPAFLELVARRFDVAPLGPRSWLRLDAFPNRPEAEQALIERQVVAGNGPRVRVRAVALPSRGVWSVEVRPEAPAWMGLHTVTLHGDQGSTSFSIASAGAGEPLLAEVPLTTTWLCAEVRGLRAHPVEAGESWAITAPLSFADP